MIGYMINFINEDMIAFYGQILRKYYENGRIKLAEELEEVLENVLHHCEKI